LTVDQTWLSPGVPNGNGGMKYHRTWTTVWKLNARPPLLHEDTGDDVAAGPATMWFSEDDVGLPQSCGDITRQTGSAKATFRDVLTLDGSTTSSDPFVQFNFQRLGKVPTLKYSLRREYGCGAPDVFTESAGSLLPQNFQAARRVGWGGGILINRTTIAGKTIITCASWQVQPPRTKAECNPIKLKNGAWEKSVYTIQIGLNRLR
jgi:hypothetical protein